MIVFWINKNIWGFPDSRDDDIVPINNVDSDTLSRVLAFCKYLCDEKPGMQDHEQNKYKAEFMDVSHNVLFAMIIASNFLNFQILLDELCKHLASQIKGKTAEQIRNHFGIENDFTPEEQKLVDEESNWCKDAFI